MLIGKKAERRIKGLCGLMRTESAHCEESDPQPLISEMLDGVREARKFTNLDLRGLYNLMTINAVDEYNAAFRTSCCQFEYRVMLFGLTNTPAMFQSSIEDRVWSYIEYFDVYYPQNILIYSTNKKEHEEYMCQVLQQHKEFGRYCNAQKCQFGVSEVGFLVFVMSPVGVDMESDQFSTIKGCPRPKSIWNDLVLLGFTNFYCRFISKYSKVTLFL
jgi:hypothetical protein